MPRKLTTAQPKFKILVANLAGGSDPSRGPAGNPVKIRTAFEQQYLPEVGGRGPDLGPGTQGEKTPGLHNHHWNLLTDTVPGVPVPAAGTVTVTSTDFSGGASLYLGQYVLIAGEDYSVTTGTTYPNEDITNTAPNGVLTLFDTAGPNLINVPANLPIAPGTVTINWTSGAAPYSQTDDGAGGFTGDGTPGGSAINYTTGAITLDTAALPPDVGTFITITYTAAVTTTDIATALAAAISALIGYTATPVGAVLTIAGPTGPDGSEVLFEAIYGGSVQNFTLSPTEGHLAGAEPVIGPVEITP